MAEVGPIAIAISAFRDVLRSERIPYTTELGCQKHIEGILDKKGIDYRPEYQIGQDRIDLFFPRSGLAVEIKANKEWSKMQVFRQCERYLKHDVVKGLVLVTAKAQGMPSTVNEKPVSVFYLGANSL